MNLHEPGKYIVLISVHGLIRGHDLELGRDADTGGQTKYVLDLARALGDSGRVSRVDLVTRKIVDAAVSDDYAVSPEILSPKAQIVRVEAGPEEYIAKEQMWDHLDSFTDNLIDWLNRQPRLPDIFHSHYADAGYVGVRLANLLGIPLVHTGHSLGRDKRQRLLASGLSRDEIERTYNISRRIEAEEQVLANADLVVTSTNNEVEVQYELYNYYDPDRMRVIPPGTDLDLFHPSTPEETIPFESQVDRFLTDSSKPLILALSRPDERKNISTLIEAYGGHEGLRSLANLLIIAGVRDDIRDMDAGAQAVLTDILTLIDAYDLYGKVAIPKSHQSGEVPSIYRLAARRGGVFINPALTEPFGLTLLEAAASGLPIVATKNGGPVDIVSNCHNGLLVDPLDSEAIAAALSELLRDRDAWARAARSGLDGVRRHYSWQSHAEQYLDVVDALDVRYVPLQIAEPLSQSLSRRDRAIFSDLDQNLLGDPQAMERFMEMMREHRRDVVFGIATGRRLDSALAMMNRFGMPRPDVLITGLGTRVHYGQHLNEDHAWADHIDHHWNPQRVRRTLDALPGLELQPRMQQSAFKVSYYIAAREAPTVEEIVALLRQKELTANVVCSFGQFLDVVPSRASKGTALRYAAQRLDIPLERILVAGGSGADEDMMRGNTLAVVVGNRHDEELSQLTEIDSIYFAEQPYAMGIMEAIEHYDFFQLPSTTS